MTATLDTMANKKEPGEEPAELAAARELVRRASGLPHRVRAIIGRC
jgi:hypothetical protein